MERNHANLTNVLTSQHHVKTVSGEISLASLLEKAHASLTGVNPGDHHTKYLNSEAVSAMGVKADNNPLHHDRPTSGGIEYDSGTYTGNMVNNRDIAVSFTPKCVHLTRYEGGNYVTWMWMDSYPAWKCMRMDQGASIYTDVIDQINANSFQVDNNQESNNGNRNGITYYWCAWG